MRGEVHAGPEISKWYGSVYVDNLRDDYNRSVPIHDYLAIQLQSPVKLDASDFHLMTHPWKPVSTEVSNRKLDPWTYGVTAMFKLRGGYTLFPNDAISVSLNGTGDLTKQIERVMRSVRVAADKLPTESDYVRR